MSRGTCDLGIDYLFSDATMQFIVSISICINVKMKFSIEYIEWYALASVSAFNVPIEGQ